MVNARAEPTANALQENAAHRKTSAIAKKEVNANVDRTASAAAEQNNHSFIGSQEMAVSHPIFISLSKISIRFCTVP